MQKQWINNTEKSVVETIHQIIRSLHQTFINQLAYGTCKDKQSNYSVTSSLLENVSKVRQWITLAASMNIPVKCISYIGSCRYGHMHEAYCVSWYCKSVHSWLVQNSITSFCFSTSTLGSFSSIYYWVDLIWFLSHKPIC